MDLSSPVKVSKTVNACTLVHSLSLPRLPPSHLQELKQMTKEEAVKLVWDYLTANNCKVGSTLSAMREQGVQGSGTRGLD